jgi:hypothetical protein
MKKLVKTLIFLFIGLLLPIGYIISYDTSTITSFAGLSHDDSGCHSTSYTFSVNGTINLTSSAGNAVSVSSEFTISATIINFTEAASNSVSLGFSSERSSNNQFEFTPGYLSVSVNSSGNAITQNFTVKAPSSGGTFTITVDSLNDPDGNNEEPLKWIYSSIEIKVEGSTNGGPPDDLLRSIIIIGGTMSGVGVLAVQIFLSVKYLKKPRSSRRRESVTPKKSRDIKNI